MSNLSTLFDRYKALVVFDTETSGLDFDSDQLSELLAERKKLHIIDEENLRYNCDIIALEYAIGALRR